MMRTVKIMLLPNNKQETKLFQSAGTARFAYNWALGRFPRNFKIQFTKSLADDKIFTYMNGEGYSKDGRFTVYLIFRNRKHL